MKYLEFFRRHGIKVIHIARKMKMRETHLRYYLLQDELPEKFKPKFLKFFDKYAKELAGDIAKMTKDSKN